MLVNHLHTKEFKNLEKEVILNLYNRTELEKACFGHDAAYFESKGLAKRTISDEILKERANEIARNHGYDGY